MPLPVQKLSQAKVDLIEIAAYIAKDNPEAAERFLDAAEATFNFIASLPGVGKILHLQSPAAQGIQIWRVEGFERYLIVYRAVEYRIEIVRVLHSARDFPALFE